MVFTRIVGPAPTRLSLMLVYGVTLSAAAEAADLRMRFVYKGPAPRLKPSEAIVVDPQSKGVKDIAVYVDAKRTVLPSIPPPRHVQWEFKSR